MKRVWAFGIGLAVAGTVAITFFPKDTHPEFGLIRSSRMTEPHSPSRFVGLVLEAMDLLRQFLSVDSPGTGRRFLEIGSHQLEWSLMSTERKSGWLHFGGLKANTVLWEFAPCARLKLADVRGADLSQAQSIRSHETNRIQAAFNSDSWVETNMVNRVVAFAIPVREGQIILSRLMTAPDIVYILKFKNQLGSDSWGGVSVEYVQFDTRQADRDRRASGHP